MKNTIFEKEESMTRDNITYHFQPNQHFDAIKEAIVKRAVNNRKKASVFIQPTPSPSPPPQSQSQQQSTHEHVGGLPSPPVEDKKVVLLSPKQDKSVLLVKKQSRLNSHELRNKIESLKEEKHRLFQLIKQLMLQEQQQKKLLQQQQQKQEIVTNKPPVKRKSRWSPPESNKQIAPSYFYPRPRYNNQPRQQQPFNNNFYSQHPSPYSR